MTDIDPAGPARLAQLKTNQVILEVNRRRVHSLQDYLSAVAGLKRGEVAALLVYDRTARISARSAVVVPDPEP